MASCLQLTKSVQFIFLLSIPVNFHEQKCDLFQICFESPPQTLWSVSFVFVLCELVALIGTLHGMVQLCDKQYR